MIWPFTISKRTQKLEALQTVMTEQKEAADRLQDNLRQAHSKKINDLLKSALPQFERGPNNLA